MTSLVASENLMNRRNNTYLDAQSSCVSRFVSRLCIALF